MTYYSQYCVPDKFSKQVTPQRLVVYINAEWSNYSSNYISVYEGMGVLIIVITVAICHTTCLCQNKRCSRMSIAC